MDTDSKSTEATADAAAFRPAAGPRPPTDSTGGLRPVAMPAPEAEDTVPLDEITGLPDLGLRVLTGHALLHREVRWAHVSELADPAPYLDGGELLLTAGLNLPAGPRRLHDYARSLAATGVTALGFGLAPVHTEVPAALVEACEKYRLPLLAVPRGTPFLAVSRAVGHALEDRRAARQRGLAEAQGQVTRAALHGRPRVPAVLAAVAEAVDGWAVLLDHEGRPVRTAGGAPEPSPDVVRLALQLGRGSGPRSAADASGGVYVDLHPVDSAQARTQVLVLGRTRPFTPPDRAVTAVCVGLLGLLAETERTAGVQDGLMTRLLLGEDPGPTASGAPSRAGRLLHALFGTGEPEPVRVLRGVWKPGGAATGPRTAPDDVAAVVRAIGSPLVDISDGHVCAIAPAGTSVEQLTALHAESGWLGALSRPVEPGRLTTAAQEARLLLERAVTVGTPLVARAAGPGVGELVDRALAEDWARQTLRPIAERSADGTDLIGLLRTWLACHGNWDRTAKTVGIHRNSVRHRVARMEHLLGTDLSDPDTRAQLWLALTWHGTTPHDGPGHRPVTTHRGGTPDDAPATRRGHAEADS